MVIYILYLTIAFVIATVIGAVSIPRIVKLANSLHLYDLPNSRKVHKLPIPRLGGVAFLPAVVIAIAVIAAFNERLEMFPLLKGVAPQHYIAYIAGAMMLYILGIYDDVHGVGYKVKFLVQIFSAFLLCVSGLWIANMDNIFYIQHLPYWIGMPLTVLFIVYVTNAMNLIDGIDGLASGLSTISCGVSMVLCIMTEKYLLAMLATSFIGVLLAFFSYNVYGRKNKVFMGDAGSLTLGYTLSFVILHFWQKNPVWNPYFHNVGIVLLSTLVIPMLDVVRVMMSRLRDGRNPFLPDKNHIHHKLMRTGLSGRQTMVTILALSIFVIMVNYFVSSYLSQTLMVLLDVLLFFLMHYVINIFIMRYENKNGIEYNRTF